MKHLPCKDDCHCANCRPDLFIGTDLDTSIIPRPQFPVGSSVCHRSFVDCFGKHHDAVTGLMVINSQLIDPGSIPAYYRIKAVGPNGRGYVEAAERFFDAEYKIVMQSHDGDVLKNFITVSTEPDVLKRTEELQAKHPGFTALWI